MSLTVNLINQSGQSEVYFMFGGGNAPNGTHNGEKLVYGKSYSIPSATKKATVELTSFISGKIFFSFGSITLSGPNPGFQPGSGQDSTIRWDKVELTLIDNPTAVSQLNLTAADFFSIPLKAEVLKSGVSHQPSLTWQNPPTVAQIFSKLASFSSNSSKAVVTGSGGVSVPNIGDVLRVISPSTVALPNPYVSFEPYLDYVKKHKISSLLE
ncbi:MAG: beta-1,3-glucanase family protein, partial [Prochloraceae cyanobacterium]